MNKKLIVLLIGVAFFITGTFLTISGISVVRKAGASESWPSITGQVTNSTVAVHRNNTGTGKKKRRKLNYEPDINYSYSVDGVTYNSAQVIFGSYRSGSKAAAQEIANRYSAGSQVSVYYDPGNPHSAVLEPGFKSSSYIQLLIGIAFLIAGVIVVLIGLVRRFP